MESGTGREDDHATRRSDMVAEQIEARGVTDQRVLDAMRSVPREQFLPQGLVEFAYEDTPLPIASGQTISQPYIVALMAEALRLEPGDRVLEVGAGSGYAAAVLARLADRVYTIERHRDLADAARATLRRLDIDNVEVLHGDGTQGWPEAAPFDAIVVAAGSPADVPEPLLEQLAVGGRMVIPAGSESAQKLWRIVRTGEDEYQREDLGSVRFVPLIGRSGWQDTTATATPGGSQPAETVVAEACEPFRSVAEADLAPLLERIGNARVVLLGEASHGTQEFYDMRSRITRRLIEEKGFNVVALEADWPDAAVLDAHVRGDGRDGRPEGGPFQRFPTWMWANRSVLGFVNWLAARNGEVDAAARAGIYGLDLYSMFTSIDSVLEYLDSVDPETAELARERYACLMPWSQDPAGYGRVVLSDRYRACEEQVVEMLQDLQRRRLEYAARDGERFFDAARNASLVQSAERYYRAMYYGSRPCWNLRDQHMFDTLKAVLDFRGTDARAVVWAHNSHLGDARGTEMGAQGEHNVGQLVREHYGDAAYLVGFGTDRGTVAAASHWGGEMERKQVRPALAGSYERLCHDTAIPNFLLPLREGAPGIRGARRNEVRERARNVLSTPRLERAIGVIYRPETERQSHYFQAELPEQFDEYVFIDETTALDALPVQPSERAPDTFPFGL
ncbi:MAG: protein-L-isoaspartate(D-aspartate) O-methyltransferase [Gammaproteobacteria bacterium]|jgi:protein-L-isoaspartate(D-aspartate) O-methyltransferase|nr:protein-L-isoaspartate(D-aspartate) O-methyltransferase [Gammaproteobacteria bacterium]